MKPILAPLAAIRISIGKVMVMPTPTAGPLIAAIEGFRQLKIASTNRPPPGLGLANTPAPWLARGIEARRTAGDVGAGAEGAAGAGDDDGADIVVGVGALKGVGDFGAHLAGIGVELFRAVEGDDQAGTVEVAGDVLVVHGAPPTFLVCRR